MRMNWKKKLFEDFGHVIGKKAQKNKGYYTYKGIYEYFTAITDYNKKIDELGEISHYINTDLTPKIGYNLTRGGLKTKIKQLKKLDPEHQLKTYKKNYIKKMEDIGLPKKLQRKIRKLSNNQLLIFSTFYSSTIEYLYLQENIDNKIEVINEALDEVSDIEIELLNGGDIETVKERITKAKFKKYGGK